MSRHHQRYIALKLAYLGWQFDGLAVQNDTNNTIEVLRSTVRDGRVCVRVCASCVGAFRVLLKAVTDARVQRCDDVFVRRHT
jgi:hypothetical protein